MKTLAAIFALATPAVAYAHPGHVHALGFSNHHLVQAALVALVAAAVAHGVSALASRNR